MIGLPLAQTYGGYQERISRQQCERLAALADRWRLAWSYSEHQFKRYFRKTITYYIFHWSYEP